jgi:hypothetical protein
VIVAGLLGRPASTVWKVLHRHGRSRLPKPTPEPVRRYERKRPGELVHVDIKRLGRFWTVGKRIHQDGITRSPQAGWQYLHLAIDDHSRLAYAELRPSESPADCVAFLHGAAKALTGYLRWYNRHRPHSSIGGKPPISRVLQVRGSYS